MKQFWGWELATYLYFGGLGGAMLAFAAVLGIIIQPSGMDSSMMVFPVLIALVILAVGTGLLVFELGQPIVFERAFVTKTAVIKWGAVFLSISMVFAALFIIFELGWVNLVPTAYITGGVWEFVAKICLGLSGFFGACVFMYTGTMLSSLKAKAFWNTPALPVLFSISALSTGACMMALTYGVWPFPDWFLAAGSTIATPEYMTLQTETVHFFHHADLVLAITEIIVMLMYVLLMFCAPSSVDAKKVAERWVRGSWAPLFWGGMMCGGLVLPVLFNIIGGGLGNYAAPVLALLGGWLFRFMIIWSADRKLYAGEETYYSRLPQKHADFEDYYLPGTEYFEIVNADQFDDMFETVEGPKTPILSKLKWALTKDHGNLPEPNPAYPNYRKIRGTEERYQAFPHHAAE